jgi:hypothetical protein
VQIAMSPDIEPPVRQAAVVHMKNQICRYWEDPVVDAETAVMQYSIIEQDRHIIREHIIDALEHAADPLRCACARTHTYCRVQTAAGHVH